MKHQDIFSEKNHSALAITRNGIHAGFRFLCVAFSACLLSCEVDTLPETEMINTLTGKKARYEELSAGTATIFNNSKTAYDTNAPWVTGELYNRFLQGDLLYDDRRIPDMDGFEQGGLGPVYGGFSCGSCHNNTGRTASTLWTEGGSGSAGFSSCLIYLTRKDGGFLKNYGRVLHDQSSIIGVKPEGKLKVTYTYRTYRFPDGEEYELATPTYRITDWYADSLAPEDLIVSVRIPLRHVGMGQMMSLDEETMKRVAAQSNYPEYGISGRCNYITEKGVTGVGLSGNKAQHLDLTVELGFSSDMGVTNSRYPEEICEGQAQVNQGSMMGLSYDQLDVSTEEMEDVDLYMQSLSVPARRNVNDPQVQRGEQMFYQAACHLCHTVTLHTRPRGSTLLNGTQLTWLGGQTIHPYSDFLLHDMGSEIMGVGLNDNYVSGLARGNEWRTTPLWGIGLQEVVNGHTYFLHDGRARNFVEAIMWHGGEAEASKNLFKNMPKADRDALVAFLRSL